MVFGLLGSGREYLGIEKVVQLTKLSQTRIRQREQAGTFPERVSFGPRAGLWLTEQVRAWMQAEKYPTTTPQASTGKTPATPLGRVVDAVAVADLGRWRWGAEGTRYHVRIFTPTGGDSRQDAVVILTKIPTDVGPSVTNAAEQLMKWVDDEYLFGAGATALWFSAYAGGPSSTLGEWTVQNIVATKQNGQYEFPLWPPTQLTELNRVLGGELEWYPEPAYTRETIERWQRNHNQIVDVTYDRWKLAPLVEALLFLHNLPDGHPRRTLATSIAPTLAARYHMIEETSGPWNDGTKPEWRDPDQGWPARFAARLVPYRPTEQAQHVIDSYPNPASLQNLARDNFAELTDWIESVDRYSDHPDETVLAHLVQTLLSLTWTLRDETLVYVPERNPTRVFTKVGVWDDRFLGAVEIDPRLENTREGRMIKQTMFDDLDLTFGHDPGNHAVAWGTTSTGDVLIGIVWPSDGVELPTGSTLVADGEAGDRPVYVAIGDTIVDLLPYGSLYNMWNFGYGGGGPGQLTEDIVRQLRLQTGLNREQLPVAWVMDQVEHSSEDRLEIRVDDAFRRIHI